MDKLTKEEVLHVAYLARINLSDKDIEKYQVELKQLIDDIDKIKDIENYDDDEMFSPVTHLCSLREDTEGEMLDYKEVMKNVPTKEGNFVEVPVMLNE